MENDENKKAASAAVLDRDGNAGEGTNNGKRSGDVPATQAGAAVYTDDIVMLKGELVSGVESLDIDEDGKPLDRNLVLNWGADMEQCSAVINYAENIQHTHPAVARAIAHDIVENSLPGVPNGDVFVRNRASALRQRIDECDAAIKAQLAKAQTDQMAVTS